MKFCKDCKYFRDSHIGVCVHPSIVPDMVDGRTSRLALIMRNRDCGLEARLFEPGPSDFVIKALEASNRAHRDALLITGGIGVFVIVTAFVVSYFSS